MQFDAQRGTSEPYSAITSTQTRTKGSLSTPNPLSQDGALPWKHYQISKALSVVIGIPVVDTIREARFV